ncbi:MAG: glycosyltransferase [Crocinitomicaceae bacterium]
MTKKKKHFTIVCYTFPPSKAIGGRRWAKFCQQLAKKGHDVSVITTDMNENQNWYLQHFENISFHFLDAKYPNWLEAPKGFFEKLKYRIYIKFLNSFFKHNLFDKAFRWEKQLLKELSSVHSKKEIDYLIVTGAPFSLLYFGTLFKSKHPKVKLISDFRDPWTWGFYYGLNELKGKKKSFQQFMERQTIEKSDLVCYPTQEMGEDLLKIYPNYQNRFKVIPHAYDEEKISGIKGDHIRKGFIYGGSLYPGIESYLEKLEKVIHSHKNFKWEIYTGAPETAVNNIFKGGNVHHNGLIDEQELFRKIKNSSAYLAFFPESDKDLISTKFFEIIYLETPIIIVVEEGAVGKFIRENQLGVHILPKDIEKEFPKYLDGTVPFNKGIFDVSRFEYSKVTDLLIQSCESLEGNQ